MWHWLQLTCLAAGRRGAGRARHLLVAVGGPLGVVIVGVVFVSALFDDAEHVDELVGGVLDVDALALQRLRALRAQRLQQTVSVTSQHTVNVTSQHTDGMS